ncbi:SDR family NAD(P)-dependent oxidoreductase [Caballeronia sp. LP006]|uniref:SDR family NAD(P)-dependent oxidoreductase n=1 Tax=unclassified Caballeronia TaxID=2646786 RepID=UPI001FD47CE1|nr:MULTISPECIES: SDR family NAD(P)-dependent oxidoreductase [unclassified Caballeronia]MDR5829794.1 SDR family NAD(P)-dependent oxidoreductase [Caballeronia sp. LP006]
MSNPLNLEGQRILVTGAASGIGLATSQLFSALGAAVVMLDRDDARLQQASAGLNAKTVTFDLLDTERLPGLFAELAQAGGPFSGLVHAAGISSIAPTRLLTPARYREVFSVNAEAALALLRGFQHRSVCRANGGSVVFISSVMSIVGSAGASAYAMSKAALTGLAKSAALEFAPRSIRVNCIAPGFVKTAMFDENSRHWSEEQRKQIESAHPLGLGTPEDIANAAAFLVADSGRWITGSVLVCDGGYTAS